MKRTKMFLLIVLLTVLILSILGCGNKEYHYFSKNYIISYPIKSLGINNDISGSFSGAFFVGFGSLDTSTYYYVYADAGNGKYILKKYDAELTYLQETDGKPRFKEIIKYFITDNNSENFTVDGIKFRKQGWPLPSFYVGNEEYTASDTFNSFYNDVAQHVKLRKNQTLYVSTEPVMTLYVPKGTIKVKFNADVNNIK